MKNGTLFILVVISVLMVSLKEEKPIIEQIDPTIGLKDTYLSQLDSLIATAEVWSETNINDYETYLERFYAVRKAYKKVEMWVEYYQPEFVQDYINGPPLLKPERNTPKASIVEPKGLQIIEELMLEKPIDRYQIRLKAVLFVNSLQELRAFSNYTRIEHRHCFEAMKLELNRLFSLGLSGFDSPGKTTVIDEASIALIAVSEVYNAYSAYIKLTFMKRHNIIHERANTLFKSIDFNQFDRFEFLTEVVNPMMELLVETQVDLQVEFNDLTSEIPDAVNFRATNLFSKDYLNVSFFSALIPSQNDDAKRLLGEKLFFDSRLSGDNSMSCASCHDPLKGFADGLKTSSGINGESLKRNSPGLMNAIYSKKFFWDARADMIQQQIEHVIFNEKEFGSNYQHILTILEKDVDYSAYFRQVYPTFKEPINRNNLLDALTKYVSTLTGFNSRFDKAVRNESIQLTNDERSGFNLFMGKAQCAICHFAPTFNGTVPPYFRDSESEVIGVPNVPNKRRASIDSDEGRMLNGVPSNYLSFYQYSFKTPTVRNVSKTAPYMHNGVFGSLKEVIDFYNDGGGVGRGFKLSYQTLPFDRLHLTRKEKRQLESFLISLEE